MTSRNAVRLAVLLAVALPALGAVSSADSIAKKPPVPLEKKLAPLVPHDKFPKDCSQCHVAKQWDVLKPEFRFDHARETGVALKGAHAKISCTACHNDRGLAKKGNFRDCASCHQDIHKGSLGKECLACHVETSWRPMNQALQHFKTRFPLTGAHQAVECARCHAGADKGDYHGASLDCFSCHRTDFAGAPNHAAMNYPRTCDQCHNTSAFASGRFNHNALAANANCYVCHQADFQSGPNHIAMNFPQTCGQCHGPNTWAGARFNHGAWGSLPPCWNCHQTDYARGPNHAAQNYPHGCAECHNTTSWSGARFNHGSLGGNPACWSCHQAEYARGPNHAAQNYPHGCAECHNTVSWSGARFNHGSLGGNLACWSCHQADYARGPNHAAQNYSHNCAQCHATTTWLGARFDHNAIGGLGADCYTCHADKFAQGPDHVAMNYPHACGQCHTNFTAWSGATFNHSQWFNLTRNDNHRNAVCTQCHQGGVYSTFTCLACHPHSSKAQTDSNHQGKSGYSYGATSCYNCHKS